MTKQELKAKIDKLENGIKSKATPSNLIAPLKAQKAKLEKELQDMEAAEKKAIKTKKVSKVAEKIKAAKKSVAKKTPAKAPAKEERKKDNIARDGDRKSLPAGKRISKTGKVYYETRVNRSDKQTSRKPYLADGGKLANGKYKYEKGDEGMFQGDEVRVVKYTTSYGGTYEYNIIDENGQIKTHGAAKAEKFENQFRYFPKMANGGKTEEGVDLFEDYDNIPSNVQEVLDKYSDAFEDGDYRKLEKANNELNKIGYTFEYGLDGEAYDLRKIGQKGKMDEDEYAKGGYVIFEGRDNYNDKPLYKVISKDEDNDYDGEFHDNREDAEKELNELKNKNMNYGYGGKTKSIKSMKDITIEQISSMTGVGKAGIERFSDENNLSEEDLSNIMQGLGRRMISASDFATAVSGNKDNQYTKEIVDFAKSGKGYKMADGGEMKDAYVQQVVEIATKAHDNGIKASDMTFDEFNKEVFEIDNTIYGIDYVRGAYMAMKNRGFADGGMMDEVNTELSTIRRNIMGTTSMVMKIKGMKKPQDFIVYPISADQAGKPITIQSDTRFGFLDLSSGRGLMSQSHPNGAYSYHFTADKKVPFKLSETDLQRIKEHISGTAGSSVGNMGVSSDNSGASMMASGGYMAHGGEVKKVTDGDDTYYLTYIDSTHFYLSNSKDYKGNAFHIAEFRSRPFYDEVKSWLKSHKGEMMAHGGEVDKFTYMMLGRLQSDNEYYLGNGNRYEKALWAGNVDDQISEMKKLWNQLPEDKKPEWLSMEDILEYERKMKSDKMAKGGKVPAHFGSGRNIDVFGYQTQNFDICGTAVKEFESAVEIMQNGEENQKESLARCAKHIDSLFGVEKAVVEDGVADDANFYEAYSDSMAASIYNYRAELFVNLFSFVPQHLKEIAVRMEKAEKGGLYALGGMTAGRWYRDKSGEEFKFIGKIDSGENKGKFLFTDGQKSVYKDLEDFEGGRPKETKLFGFFEDGGSVAEGNYEMLMSNIKAIKHHAEELEGAVTPNTEIEAWVLSKSERAETDLSDITHYLDGLKMADGGYMADGGELSGLIADIYRSDYNSKTNKMYGKRSVTIIDKEVPKIFEADESKPAVRLVRRKLPWGDYIHAIPYDQPEGAGMFGGTFIYSSDSRFPSKYPIPLHDRVEMEKGGYMAKGGDLSSIKKKYEENEDENAHSENVVLLAKHFGTKEDLAKAKEILALHEKEGSLSSENGKKRQELHLKLIGKARTEMGKQGIEFEKGGYMAEGGGVDEIDMEKVESAAKFYTDESRWSTKPTISKFEAEIKEIKELKRKLDNKETTPSKIIGSGYKSNLARPLAYRWLKEQLLIAERAIEMLKEKEKMAYGGMMAKGGEIAFDNSNLYLNGFGMDSNGNSVVKVSFPNQRAFSIQTNGVLKETNNLYTKNIKELTEAQIKTIEKEVVDYVKQFGSKEQKQRLKTYSGYMAKGGEFKPYGKTKGKYKIEYTEDGEKQSEVWESKEMVEDRGKRLLKLGHTNIKITELKQMAKGGIYSSDSLYILKVSKDGKEVGEERFRAKNIREAKEMGEDYEEKYKNKFGGDLSFSVKEAMADGGKVGGRGWENYEKGKRITKISELKVGEDYLIYNKQFNAKNIIRITSGDKTPLKRDIVYGGFVRNKNDKKIEGDFAIWGYELKDLELYEIKEMASGGKVKFADKVKSVQESLLKRKKVSPKVQKDYGKTYSKAEAKESAQRIVGSRMAQLKEKMAKKKK
jgi:hypothetical protein